MATVPLNNLAWKFRSGRLAHPVDQTGVAIFNQGDLVYIDQTSFVLKALDSDAHAQYLAGVALMSSQLALYTNAQTGSANVNLEPFCGVGFGDVFNFTGIAGQTYTQHGLAVYYATDAQHVTAAAGSYLLGYVWNPLQTALAGAVNVPVLVRGAWPTALI